MVEQRYAVAARAFLLLPQLLGAISPDWRRIADQTSPAYLQALAAQMLSDVTRTNQSLPVLTFKSQFRFESEDQREAFMKALRTAVTEVIARHTSAYSRFSGRDAPGQPFRLVLGCYPYEPEPSSS
jgi:hypothetical protein